jgi:hypothetical protein
MNIAQSMNKGWKVALQILSVISVGGAIASYFHDAGGTLSAKMQGEEITNQTNKEIVVFTDDSHITSHISAIHPTLFNSSSYSIRDFNLKYQLQSNGVQIIPTDYFTLHNNEVSSYTLEYNKSVLSGSAIVDDPIREIVVPDNGGELKLQASATYDGCSNPFTYTLCAKYYVVPNQDNLDFDRWTQKCQQHLHLSESTSSVIWIAKNGNWEYRDYLALSNRSQKQETQQNVSKPSKTVAPTTTTVSSNTTTSSLVKKEPESLAKDDTKHETESNLSDNSSQDVQSNPIVSFKQYKDTTSSYDYQIMEFVTSDQYKDSVLYVCIQYLDSVKKERYSGFSVLYADKDLPKGHFLSGFRKDCKVIDYALCEEDPAPTDLVRVKEETVADEVKYKIENKARHAVAILIMVNNKVYDNVLLKPREEKQIYNPKNYNITFRCFNVPQSVLTEEYTPLSPLPSWTFVKYAAIWGLCMFLIFIVSMAREISCLKDVLYLLVGSFAFTEGILLLLTLTSYLLS